MSNLRHLNSNKPYARYIHDIIRDLIFLCPLWIIFCIVELADIIWSHVSCPLHIGGMTQPTPSPGCAVSIESMGPNSPITCAYCLWPCMIFLVIHTKIWPLSGKCNNFLKNP